MASARYEHSATVRFLHNIPHPLKCINAVPPKSYRVTAPHLPTQLIESIEKNWVVAPPSRSDDLICYIRLTQIRYMFCEDGSHTFQPTGFTKIDGNWNPRSIFGRERLKKLHDRPGLAGSKFPYEYELPPF